MLYIYFNRGLQPESTIFLSIVMKTSSKETREFMIFSSRIAYVKSETVCGFLLHFSTFSFLSLWNKFLVISCYVFVEAVMNIIKLRIICVFKKICGILEKCFAQDLTFIQAVSYDKMTMAWYIYVVFYWNW